MEIVLASRNAHKIKEIGAVLGRCGLDGIKLLSLDDIGFTGEIDETGATFAENAVIKASVPASMGYVSIADDSGLEVDYLDGGRFLCGCELLFRNQRLCGGNIKRADRRFLITDLFYDGKAAVADGIDHFGHGVAVDYEYPDGDCDERRSLRRPLI